MKTPLPGNTPINNVSEDESALGFRFAGRRELLSGDRWIIRWRAVRSWALFWGCVLAFLVVLFFALGTGVFIEETQGIHRIGALLLTLFLFALTIPLVFATYFFWCESRALGRDAREGRAERYAGVLTAEDEVYCPFRLLVKEGLLGSGSSQVQWYELLPRSGFLWQVNGTRPRRWLSMASPRPRDVAETPDYAAVAAEWTEPIFDQGETFFSPTIEGCNRPTLQSHWQPDQHH